LDKKLQALCRQLDGERPGAGILICDELLADGATGRLKAIALRYRASFMLQASEAWAPEAVGYLQEALPRTRRYPVDRAHVLHLFVSAISMYGSPEVAQPYADEYFQLAEGTGDPEVRQWIPKVWFNLGCSYASASEWTHAETPYRRSIDAASTDSGGFSPRIPALNLVRVLVKQGRLAEAETMLAFAKTDLDPQYKWNAWDQEAQYLLAVGDFATARALCEKVLDDPECPDLVRAETLGTLAQIVHAEGKVETAGDLLEMAMDLAIRIPSAQLASALTIMKFAFSRKGAPQRHA
jgi:hypothetical protein